MDLQSFYGNDEVEAAMRNLVRDSQEIEGHAKSFIARLSRICTVSSQVERWGKCFKVLDDETSVEIETAFGSAWAKLTIGIDPHSKTVQGYWNIWKRAHGEDGLQASSLVATLRISGAGDVFLGKENNGMVKARRTEQTTYDKTAEQIMSAILYALGAH